jgi:hypothetical protein
VFDTSRLQCPICSEEVDVDADECPKCGTLFGDGESDADLDLFADLTCPVCNTPLDEDDTVCPGCGQEIEITDMDDEEPAYPLALTSEFGMTNGSGMTNGRGMTNGAGMTNGRGMTNGAGMVNGRGMTNGAGMTNGRGMTNGAGMTNGRGMTNGAGLTNGAGMVNGRGMTNGAGMVNGRGMVNGAGLTNGASMVNGGGFINGRGGAMSTRADMTTQDGLVNGNGIYDLENGERLLSTRMIIPPRRHRAKPLAMTMVLVMVLVLVGAMMVMVPGSQEAVTIDGDFSDWSGVRRYSDRTGDTSNANLDIDSYAIKKDGDDLAVYVQVTGRILDGNTPVKGVDTLLVMFDVDGNDNTGYLYNGMGIDRRVEVRGWDNEVNGASMNEFVSSRDSRDWNGFVSIGSVAAKSKGDALELKATGAASWMADDDAIFAVTLTSSDVKGDWTAFAGDRPGAVEVRQRVLGQREVYLDPGSHNVLRIDVSAYDTEAQVDYMSVGSVINPPPTRLDLGLSTLYLDSNQNGDYDSGDLQMGNGNWGFGDDGGLSFNMENPLVVQRGTIQRLFLVVNVLDSAQQGRAVKLAVPDSWSFEAGTLPVTVAAPEGLAWYIKGYDLPIAIDGLFEDWDHVIEDGNVTLHEDELGDGPRSSLDLYHYATFIDPEPNSNRMLMYAETDPADRVLLGTPFPLTQTHRFTDGGGGGGGGPGPVEQPELFGDDAAQFFLKIEGAGEGRSVYGIRATHVVDVRGENGLVTAASLWSYTGNPEDEWVRENALVVAAAGGNEVEASMDLSSLGKPEVALVILMGWDGVSDIGSPAVVDDPAGETRKDWDLGDGPLPIPEFSDLLAPFAATLVAYGLVRRRRRR